MNLDELVTSILETKLRDNLIRCVNDWKADDQDVDHLAFMINKWHGNTWFQKTDASDTFHSNFQKFKVTAIEGIGGLTVNERLYWFGLFDIWDKSNEQDQQRIRAKIKAQV